MKILFSALVLINIGYYMWQSWYVEPPGAAYNAYSESPVNVDKMKLVADSKGSLKRRTKRPATQALTDRTPERLCYRIGPFPKEKAALDVRRWLADSVVAAVPREVSETRTVYRVALPPLASAQAVAKMRKRLIRQGFKDHVVLADAEEKNVISVGVFSVKANANKRLRRLKKKGFKAIKKTQKTRRSRYWLEIKSENDLQKTLNKQKWSSAAVTAKGVDCGSGLPGIAKSAAKR